MIFGQETILLTPETAHHVAGDPRQAMLRDWASWDPKFNHITTSLCCDLVDIVHGGGTLTPRDKRILVPENCAYCQRLIKICLYLGRDAVTLPIPEYQAASATAIDKALTHDPSITHVAQVHLETGAEVLNPLTDIARICQKHPKGLIVDAMS